MSVVVPIGGGGLISGVSMAVKGLKPSVKIIGVESSGAPGMLEERAGRPCGDAARGRLHHRRVCG